MVLSLNRSGSKQRQGYLIDPHTFVYFRARCPDAKHPPIPQV